MRQGCGIVFANDSEVQVWRVKECPDELTGAPFPGAPDWLYFLSNTKPSAPPLLIVPLDGFSTLSSLIVTGARGLPLAYALESFSDGGTPPRLLLMQVTTPGITRAELVTVTVATPPGPWGIAGTATTVDGEPAIILTNPRSLLPPAIIDTTGRLVGDLTSGGQTG
jgi:hypothetical protein